jgi:diaminopimelate decarboxylase
MSKAINNPWLSRIDDSEISQMTKQLIKSEQFNDHDQWVLVYNTKLLRDRLRYLKEHFPSDTLHTLAIKSCPLVSILKIAVEEGFGLEAASIEEVHLALKAGSKGNKIIFDSPVKTRDELSFSLKNNIHINADNFDELERINNLRTDGSTSNIGLRINPEVGEGAIAMTSVAGGASKFGLSLSTYRNKITESFKQYPWLNGLHIHVGSQGCSLDLLLAAAKVIDQFKTDINQATQNKSIKWIDIGGGFPSNYGFKTQAIDAKHYINQIKKVAPNLFEQPLMTENGRSILANCAFAISRIEYLKPHQNKLTATIHFGADFMMRPVYVPKDWKHEYLILDKNCLLSQAKIIELSIAGPLCFSGDYLERDINLPTPKQNDFIVAKDVGAYTLSTWSRHCNRRLPKVLGYSDSGISTLFKGESFEDVIKFWS